MSKAVCAPVRTVRTVAIGLGLVLLCLIGLVNTISLYYISINGRYAATPMGTSRVLILDTRTGRTTVKEHDSYRKQLVTVVLWSDD